MGRVIGSTLRTRAKEEKADIVRSFLDRFGEDLAAGEIRPILHQVFPLEEAPAAHRLAHPGDGPEHLPTGPCLHPVDDFEKQIDQAAGPRGVFR